MLVLGANGQLARNTTRVLLQQSDAQLTLYLRRASRLENPDPSRVPIVEGDVLDTAALRSAMQGQDVVYANLAGDMARQARSIIDAMHETGVKRLIFISSMGIYGEVPGEAYRSVLDPYRDSAAVIEALGSRLHNSEAGLVRSDTRCRLPAHAQGRAVPRARCFAEQPV